MSRLTIQMDEREKEDVAISQAADAKGEMYDNVERMVRDVFGIMVETYPEVRDVSRSDPHVYKCHRGEYELIWFRGNL